jgi:hypothetical protein
VDAGADRAHELLVRAVAARQRGDTDEARASYVRAYDLARSQQDVELMTDAALGLAKDQTWGALTGRAPAFLHEAYTAASGQARARLAVALTRAWVYAGNAARATAFGAEAVTLAEDDKDPILLAEALDAELLVHWGPDHLADRLRITERLEETVAHLADVEARLSAHLWRLTTALEGLDAVAVQRQLRALDLLAEESGSARVRFFAASRRGMHALLVGDVAAARLLLKEVSRAGEQAGEPDTFALEHTLAGAIARQTGDRAELEREAEIYQLFGTREGAPSVTAQAAQLWLAAGATDKAGALLHQVAGTDFAAIPRDVEWLLTITALTEVAVGVRARDLVESAAELLRPYAGRAVVNAGAVAFEGVVDDYLSRAALMLGQPDDAARWARAAAAAYRRLDARPWLRRLDRAAMPDATGIFHLRPAADGIWSVGREGHLIPLKASKGLQYLRLLLQRPGVEISALSLSDMVAGHAGQGVESHHLGDVLDRQALSAYRRRLTDIDSELDEASSWADDGRLTKLRAEREALLDQVASATGMHGQPRRTGATEERARVAVRKALAAAIARLDAVDPEISRLLRDCVHTGALCRYDPDPHRHVQWVLDE